MTEQPVTEENKQPQPSSTRKARVGIFFSIIAIIIGVVGFSYGYLELSKGNTELAKRVSDLQDRLASNQKEVTTIQTAVDSMQQNADKAQALSVQQEKLLSDWHAAQQGNLDKWRVAEAQHLVKIADNYLQFSHNTKVAETLLQQAEKILQPLEASAITDIRKSLTADITNLQAVPPVDVTALFSRLNALNEQIDKLPLPDTIASNAEQTTPTVVSGLPWWKAGLEYTWQGLSKIVIVRKTGPDALPLALPEERTFLYQNLHAQIENAIWGLLHENTDIYQTSLKCAMDWIKHYFRQDATETKTVLQGLEELQKEIIQPKTVSLSETLQLFDHYFAQVKTEQ